MTKTPHLGFASEYRILVRRHGEQISDSGWVHNRILDNGLNSIGRGEGYRDYISVGAGSAAVADTDVTLASHIATHGSAAETVTRTDALPAAYTVHITRSAVFPQGSVVGNITEVGVGSNPDGTNLFSRALIEDSSNAPTTIAVTAEDQLTVYYRLHVKAPVDDLTGTVDISGTTYSYTGRAAVLGSWVGSEVGSVATFSSYTGASLRGLLSNISGSDVGRSDNDAYSGDMFNTAPYIEDSMERIVTVKLPPHGHNSAGGIDGVSIVSRNNSGAYQYVISPAIPKDDRYQLKLEFTFSWGRA